MIKSYNLIKAEILQLFQSFFSLLLQHKSNDAFLTLNKRRRKMRGDVASFAWNSS